MRTFQLQNGWLDQAFTPTNVTIVVTFLIVWSFCLAVKCGCREEKKNHYQGLIFNNIRIWSGLRDKIFLFVKIWLPPHCKQDGHSDSFLIPLQGWPHVSVFLQTIFLFCLHSGSVQMLRKFGNLLSYKNKLQKQIEQYINTQNLCLLKFLTSFTLVGLFLAVISLEPKRQCSAFLKFLNCSQVYPRW